MTDTRRAPSPAALEEQHIEYTPEPPPPRESQSVPSSFRRRKIVVAGRPSSASASIAGDSRSRTERSSWARQPDVARLYRGREHVRTNELLGQWGPSMLDVKISRMGSARLEARCTPRLGRGPRFNRERCYEGKEYVKLGQFGPGLYDLRSLKTGSPRTLTPRFGNGTRFDREKAYEGRDRMPRGKTGPTGAYDPPRCSVRGSPLWRNRPSAAFAMPHVQLMRQATAR